MVSDTFACETQHLRVAHESLAQRASRAKSRVVMREQAVVWVGLFVVVLGSAVFGCGRGHAPSEAQSQPITASAMASAENLASAVSSGGTTNTAAIRSSRLDDERWKRAMGEDLADKEALADALGTAGLLEALDDGGEIATTALASLPFADDADMALGPLAKRTLSATGDARISLLTTLLGIAGQPAKARGLLDPDGATEAGAALLSIASDVSAPREQRVLAISAARALAEKKVVDPVKIPTDLDPQ